METMNELLWENSIAATICGQAGHRDELLHHTVPYLCMWFMSGIILASGHHCTLSYVKE